jgi:pyridoxal phosphate-dependent aminotransferase EpsN
MPELEGTMSNRWLTTLTIDQQKLGVVPMDIINNHTQENIEARPVWKPLHMQPVFADIKYYSHHEYWRVSEELFAMVSVCRPIPI